VPASLDAVSVDRGGRLSRRPSWPVALTLTVVILVYQQVPPPFGAIVVKSWLHYALPVLGSVLVAQFMTHAAKITWSQLQRVTRHIKKLARGFSVTYDPNLGDGRDSDHVLDEERSDGARTTLTTTPSSLGRGEAVR
jgi:hypothetical protein